MKSVLFIEPFHFPLPLSSYTYLFCVLVWHIEGLGLGVLVLWYLVVLGAQRVLSLGLPHILGLRRILLLCILCFSLFVSLLELLLMLTIPVFFCIFANGTIWSPSASVWFWCRCIRVWLIWFVRFPLYRWCCW